MSSRDNVENMMKSLFYVREENLDAPIIVEGPNDIRALRRLGFKGKIFTLPRNKTLQQFAEKISLDYSRIILLMDWDSRGKRNMSLLEKYLRHHGVNVDVDFWRLCFSMASRMSNVESLPAAYEWILTEYGTDQHT